MKSILVTTSGSEADGSVFETALAIARPLEAHLEFYHLHIDPADAASYAPGVAFMRGNAIGNALEGLHRETATRSAAAERHFAAFCRQHDIPVVDTPSMFGTVSASWRAEQHDAVHRLMFHARHSDLLVVGGSPHPHDLPPGLIEDLLLRCGRPLILAPLTPPATEIRTIMVCWKETPEAARALTVAMSILAKVQRTLLVSVDEDGDNSSHLLEDLAHQLRWNGITAEAFPIQANGSSPAKLLRSAAEQHGADMLVMGGYGHSPARELIFGGFTQSILENCNLPVLMMH